MLATTTLERVFLHKENGIEITLTDPGTGFAPEAVMTFYSATYPILTNAKIVGPEIRTTRYNTALKARWEQKDKTMKHQTIKRRVPITKNNDQWKLHQLFSDFTQKLDRLPDTAAVLRNRKRSAPQGIVPMVF